MTLIVITVPVSGTTFGVILCVRFHLPSSYQPAIYHPLPTSPGNAWPQSWYDGLTDAQRAVLEPPYSHGAQRPILGDDGELLAKSKQQLLESGA